MITEENTTYCVFPSSVITQCWGKSQEIFLLPLKYQGTKHKMGCSMGDGLRFAERKQIFGVSKGGPEPGISAEGLESLFVGSCCILLTGPRDES